MIGLQNMPKTHKWWIFNCVEDFSNCHITLAQQWNTIEKDAGKRERFWSRSFLPGEAAAYFAPLLEYISVAFTSLLSFQRWRHCWRIKSCTTIPDYSCMSTLAPLATVNAESSLLTPRLCSLSKVVVGEWDIIPFKKSKGVTVLSPLISSQIHYCSSGEPWTVVKTKPRGALSRFHKSTCVVCLSCVATGIYTDDMTGATSLSACRTKYLDFWFYTNYTKEFLHQLIHYN